jgi:hypothetical protein
LMACVRSPSGCAVRYHPGNVSSGATPDGDRLAVSGGSAPKAVTEGSTSN